MQSCLLVRASRANIAHFFVRMERRSPRIDAPERRVVSMQSIVVCCSTHLRSLNLFVFCSMLLCQLVRASRANIAHFFVRLRRYEGRGTPSPCTLCQGAEFPEPSALGSLLPFLYWRGVTPICWRNLRTKLLTSP